MANRFLSTNTAIPLEWYAQDNTGAPLSGKGAELEISVKRRSNGDYHLWGGGWQVGVAWQALTEVASTALYAFPWDHNAVTGKTADDSYQVFFRQNGGSDVVIPAPMELFIDAWIAAAGTLAAGAITAATFGAGAIDAAAIATGAIDADALATDAIGALELAASAVAEIAASVPTAASIADAVWVEILAPHIATAGSAAEAFAIIEGFLLGNYILDNVTADENGFVTDARMRIFTDGNVPATGGGAETTGLLATITGDAVVHASFKNTASVIRGILS